MGIVVSSSVSLCHPFLISEFQGVRPCCNIETGNESEQLQLILRALSRQIIWNHGIVLLQFTVMLVLNVGYFGC